MAQIKSAILISCAVGALLSCTALPPAISTTEAPAARDGHAELHAAYAALGAMGGRVFALAPDKSAVRIHVFRGGRAARLGHNHVLAAPRFSGFFYLPETGAANGRFDLEFRLDQLEFDKPEYRAALGSAFAPPLSADAIESTRAHMLGSDNLQADRFPFVRVHSLQITGEAPLFAAQMQIEMHGQQRELWVPLRVEGLPDSLSVAGSFVLRQSDFGVQPYSALGGLVAVRDELVIEFKLHGG